jgi:DNA-binding transcriptional MerR regulator
VRTHTIGEVLNQLKDEFDDITISKIRFLESEGLITPDRTESGYRKFTPDDIDRLRYVLRAQRDRYLPLKVIKDELARLDAGLPIEPAATTPELPLDGDHAPDPGPQPGAPVQEGRLLEASPTDVQLTASELADAAGLTDGDIAALRDHGLLGSGPHHDGDDLRIVKLSAQLLRSGLEPRHLRMYRQFADREADLTEALISPLLRQRNPDSRRSAADQAEHLAAIGGQLQRTLLARQLRELLRS